MHQDAIQNEPKKHVQSWLDIKAVSIDKWLPKNGTVYSFESNGNYSKYDSFFALIQTEIHGTFYSK
jgi:hypothetical protein